MIACAERRDETGHVTASLQATEALYGFHRADIAKLSPHDLRRTCARLCHLSGGELDQIQFLLGHVSIQTTERYLGCKQKLRYAVNDTLGIEPEHVT